jgi:hypothetical protein
MGVVWASNKSSNVFEAVAAVERALDEAEQRVAPAEALPEDLFMGDGYLAENVALMRAGWEINPWAVAPAGPGALGRAFDFGQRALRRLSWWYTRPQIEQASAFNGAVVRATEALLARVLRLSQRIHQLEATHSEARLRAFEEQLRAAREEHAALLRRVAQLESALAAREDGR